MSRETAFYLDSQTPRIISQCEAMREWVQSAQRAGKKIGLVPTMGALHEGHLSLVRAAREECDACVVTIFVNPTQFGPAEDFEKYPRDLQSDLDLLAPYGVEAIFAPSPPEMYPPGFSTYVEVEEISLQWEGASRPTHFRGVATVVLKLFQVAPANVAYFGQKDYQQTLVIRRMVKDLHVPVQIRVCPIVREADGLAMSSRNAYLSHDERQAALQLSRCLKKGEELVGQGIRSSAEVLTHMEQTLIASPLVQVDYVVIADPETLQPVEQIDTRVIALVAARVGKTRLIDNAFLEMPESLPS